MTVLIITLTVVLSLVVLAYPFLARRPSPAGLAATTAELAHRLRRRPDRPSEQPPGGWRRGGLSPVLEREALTILSR